MTDKNIKNAPFKVTGEDDLNRVVDILLAFDRVVVEFSMNLYNVHPRERVAIREQNRRLHHALRERLSGGGRVPGRPNRYNLRRAVRHERGGWNEVVGRRAKV